MPAKTKRLVLKIFGVALIVALVVLVWVSRRSQVAATALQGEEVYASHDCSDCHLAVHILRQKREKQEMGLIRVRKNFNELLAFLETDFRHRSFVMISAQDRQNLVEYLRTLVPP
jgi:hypothetical protein